MKINFQFTVYLTNLINIHIFIAAHACHTVPVHHQTIAVYNGACCRQRRFSWTADRRHTASGANFHRRLLSRLQDAVVGVGISCFGGGTCGSEI